MSDEFDRIFGARPTPRPSFTERVAPREPAAPPPNPTQGDGATTKGPYRAFGFFPTGSAGEACEVARWVDGTEIAEGIEFQYRFLMQIGFVGEEELRLFLPDCIVIIHGKRLRELRKKLARRMVTFIQQWNARVWASHPSGEPIVERIEIVRPEMTIERG